MSEPFFQKLHNITSGVNADMDAIGHALAQPKCSIPSHVGASKMRAIEDEAKAIEMELARVYYAVKSEDETLSSLVKEKENKVAEMEQNLDLVEREMVKHAYKPWKNPKIPGFVSPNASSSKELYRFTPIVATPRTKMTTLTPRTMVTTSSSTVMSSTPINHFQQSEILRQTCMQSNITQAGFTTVQTTPTQNYTMLIGTPVEPTLRCNLIRQKNNGTITTPEEPTMNFGAKENEGNAMNFSETARCTPDEPVMLSCKKAAQCRNTEPGTPKEPILLTKRFSNFNITT